MEILFGGIQMAFSYLYVGRSMVRFHGVNSFNVLNSASALSIDQVLLYTLPRRDSWPFIQNELAFWDLNKHCLWHPNYNRSRIFNDG